MWYIILLFHQDGRFLPGAGATEIELAAKIAQYGDSLPGLEQYSVKKFATALESFVKTLSENTGVKAKEVISKLYATHNEGKQSYGFDIEVSIDLFSHQFSLIQYRNLICFVFSRAKVQTVSMLVKLVFWIYI